MTFRHLVVAIAGLSATSAAAQMYKCTGADGKASYRDHPCDAGARQADIEDRMTGRAPAVRYYELYARDYAGMRREIDAKGPKGFHGMANWNVRYTYRWRRNGDGSCEIEGVAPFFDGEILMPRWVPGASVTAAQRSAWERFVATLKVHEDGHIEHGQQLANALSQLGGMRVDCNSVEASLKKRADALITRYIALDEEYDKKTNHGATQGVFLPPAL